MNAGKTETGKRRTAIMEAYSDQFGTQAQIFIVEGFKNSCRHPGSQREIGFQNVIILWLLLLLSAYNDSNFKFQDSS